MKFEIEEGKGSLPTNMMIWGAVVGAIIGIPVGFLHGGVGGAIAGIFLGGICGGFLGLFLYIGFLAVLFLLPWILIIGGVTLIILLIQFLWGVGR